VIGSVITSTLESLNLRFPRVGKDALAEFAKVRKALENEGKAKTRAKAAKPKKAAKKK
jgi:hypothetical protein